MAPVYTSQHNALSLYPTLFDMMCGSFVRSHLKSTFTCEKKASDSPGGHHCLCSVLQPKDVTVLSLSSVTTEGHWLLKRPLH